MKTTVMFVADSVPLSGSTIRMTVGREEVAFVTDEQGRIELELDPGSHTFRVEVGDRNIERTVTRQGNVPLFVVNVEQAETRQMNTLNTLQIDLSNLVGDRYVFETVLGRGGMGVVVKAVDRMLNRPVAIKMLSDELRENEEAQQIFLVEARNLATLSHPNLVAIHDILNVGGRVLMVFEYVLGENVEKTLKRRGRLDEKEALRVAIQLTRCVSYLHEHDLIHRDLKPANIIMQAEGTLKLVDFGLARSLNELYVRGTRVRGTPAYMAPEQIQGIHLTTATDIYQIGISLYEMLTGRLPFTTGDMAYAHVHLDAPPLRDVVPNLDPELARLVHACLEKKPKDRPASADILLEQLQQIYARLASGDSQTFPARSNSGEFGAVRDSGLVATQTGPGLNRSSEISFAEEVAGGSNRGLMAVAGIGIVALAVAAFLLLRAPGPEPAPEPVPPVVATAPEEVPTEAPSGDESVEQAVAAARGLATLSAVAAESATSEVAVAAPTETQRPEPASRSAPAPEARRPTASAAAAKPKSDKSAEIKTTRTAAKPTNPLASPEPTRNSGGLLSTDQGGGKSLLPVGK